jgi:hypothetical protein
MKRLLGGVFTFVWTLLLCGATASATDAFSNYGSSGAYDAAPSDGWLIGGSGGGSESIAEQFTSAVSGPLDSVTLSLGYSSGGTSWVATLSNDNGSDNVGTTSLVSWSFSWSAPNATGGGTFTLPYSGPLTLVAGTKYWVTVGALSTDLTGAWKWNSTGDGAPVYQGRQSFSVDGGVTWTNFFTGPRGAFKVSVVPEPAALTMFVIGFVALSLCKRRRN